MVDETNFEIGLHVATTSDDAKLAAVAGDLDKVNSKLAENAGASKDATDATKEHGGAVDELKGKIVDLVAGIVSWTVAIKFLIDSFKAAASAEEAMVQLDAVSQRFGGTVTGQLPKLHEWVDSFEEASGIAKENMIPGLNTLTLALHDTGKAQEVVEVASSMAARGLGTFEENMGVLTRTVTTGLVPLRATTAVAVMLRQGGTDLGATIDKLHNEFHDMGAGVNTTAMEMRRNAEAWDETKEKIGSVLIVLGGGLRPAMEAVSVVIAKIVSGWTMLTGVFAASIAVFKDVGHGLKALVHGDFAEVRKTNDAIVGDFANVLDKYVTKAQAMEKSVKTVWADVGKAAAGAAKESLTGMDFKPKRGGAGDDSGSTDEGGTKLPKALKLGTDSLADELKKRETFERLFYQQVQAQRDKDKKNEEDTQKLLTKDLKTMHGQRLADYVAELQKERAALTENDQRSFELDQRIGMARKQLGKEVAQANIDANVGAIDTILGAASQAFGQNKEIAAAQAIMNTYEGASKALAQGGIYGIVLAALVIAAGMKQVDTILSTEPGGGSGGGAGGSSAVYGGTSMSSPIPTIQNSSVQNSSNVRGGDTYNVSAITGSKAVAETMQLQKAFRPGSRAYDRTITSRKPVSVGTVRR